jgi:hypothetical protein
MALRLSTLRLINPVFVGRDLLGEMLAISISPQKCQHFGALVVTGLAEFALIQ